MTVCILKLLLKKPFFPVVRPRFLFRLFSHLPVWDDITKIHCFQVKVPIYWGLENHTEVLRHAFTDIFGHFGAAKHILNTALTYYHLKQLWKLTYQHTLDNIHILNTVSCKYNSQSPLGFLSSLPTTEKNFWLCPC